MKRRYRVASAAAPLLFCAPVVAQTVGSTDVAPGAAAPSQVRVVHSPAYAEDIVVTAQRRRVDVLSGVTVLSGDALADELRPTLGETLARQPGVSSTSFGPAASRPILRGLSGDRIRILTEGIGTFDASTSSVDHAVVVNPLNAERIEILRGPASLLFGSSAIGGVVNVIDDRIPRRVPGEPLHTEALALYGSAADERSGAARIDAPLGGGFVAHVDGSYLKTGNLDTGGFILSRDARATAIASGDDEIASLATLRGKLPNSRQRTWEAAGGLALVRDNGSFGVSLARYDSLYGIPIRYALTPGGEAEAVRLDVRQWRGDVRGQIDIASGFAERLLIRGGYADYRHDELEESGEIGTSFFNDGGEMRVELTQRRQGPWGGTIGAQYFLRDFRAVGEEKFVPVTRTRQASLFTLQTFDFDPLVLEGGLRVERAELDADADEDLGTGTFRRRFTAVSGSLGAGFKLSDALRVGLNLTRVERAPSPEELYSNGPHAGTQSFEIGNPGFDKERSAGAELTFRGNGEGYSFDASVYYNRYSNFIFQRQTGEIEDDLPVFLYEQGRADQRGVEVEGRARLARFGTAGLWLTGLIDYTRINIRNFGPAPLVPPLRFIGGAEYVSDALTGGVEVERTSRQGRNALEETETPGFTMVNASLAYRPFGRDGVVTFNLSANNIFDVEARRHSSILKDFAPLAGRDIRIGARFSF